eukprot:gene3120-3901_t
MNYINNLYFTREEILFSPSRTDGIDPQTEDNLRRYGSEIIQEAATSSLFLSFKHTSEYSNRKIRDFINVFTYIWQKREGLPIEYVDTSKESYWDFKGDIIISEFEILKEFGFHMMVDVPHKYILNYMKLLDKSNVLAQHSWNYLNDSMRTTLPCQYPPESLAATAIFLAARVEKVKLPESPVPWWELFDTTKDEIETISYEINQLYTKPKPYYIKLTTTNNNLQQ